MWVKNLSIENFRNFNRIDVELENGVNIVYGDNANGKTNLIEAIHFCAVGSSQRAGHDRELIHFGEEEAHLQAVVDDLGKSGQRRIDVHLFKEGRRKGIAIDHMPIKKRSELFGILHVVIFTPEDLRMVKAGPSERRAFIDLELCQLSAVYYHALRQYHQALKQRNNLLKAIAKNRDLLSTLEVWDDPLCRNGRQIMEHRASFIEEIGQIAAEIHKDIAGGRDDLVVSYRPQVIGDYEERLKRSVERDLIIGSTSCGIHKDDVAFSINDKDVRVYGSQGQQRTCALSIKLAEIEIIKKRTGHTPVLLLDDVLSELDESRQGFLFKHIEGLQTVLTCTGIEDVLKRIKGNVMKMEKGMIIR